MKLIENKKITYSIDISTSELKELNIELSKLDLIKGSILELLYSIIYFD